MNLKELKELIELVSEKGFAEFEVERQGFRMRICRSAQPPAQPPAATATPVIVPAPLGVPFDLSAAATREKPAEPTQPSPPPQPEARAPATTEADADAQLHTIKSPIVGTFYRAASPTSDPFVKIGDHVEQDSVVCIIEAMKLMNEIQAEVTGEIVKILAENGQPVEYGQPLFAVKTQ